MLGRFGHALQSGEGSALRLNVVPLEHGALVADLARDQIPGERGRKPVLLGEPELGAASENVLGVEPGGDAVEPAALREVADGNSSLAGGLHRLCGDLHITHEVHLAGFSQADLLAERLLLTYLEDLAGLSNAHALRVQIERPGFVARGDHLADLAGHRLLGRFRLREEIELNGRAIGAPAG